MKRRFLPLLAVAALSFGAGRVFSAPASDTLSLVEFRAALDQIARGQLQSAKILLQGSQGTGQIAPENALILAFLQENSGENEAARQTIAPFADGSPLSRAYAVRLGAPSPEAGLLLTAGKKPDGPARLFTVTPQVNRLEKQMLALVNAERAQKKLRPLTWDDEVAAVARAHSAEMRDKNYFAHQSPTAGLTNPIDRYRRATGDSPRIIAENVYRAWGTHSSLHENGVREGHNSLMKSPGHRENILEPEVQKIGIGIVSNRNGDIWITQVFVKE